MGILKYLFDFVCLSYMEYTKVLFPILKKISISTTRTLNRPYVSIIASMFLVLYGGLAKPKLPRFMSTLFNNMIFRMIILTLVAWTSSKNIVIAMVVAVGFTITLNLLNREDIFKQIGGSVKEDSNDGSCDNDSDCPENETCDTDLGSCVVDDE